MARIGFGRFFVVSTMILIGGLIAFAWMHRSHSQSLSNSAFAAGNERHPVTPNESLVKVDVVKPHERGMERTCILPGSIHAYEAAELFAKVPGYLKIQNVDIGDRVTAGQLLAQLDSPELQRDVDRGKAAVERAEAQVGQMKARILAAEADLNAAKTGISRAEASVKRDIAAFDFRDKQFRRFQELVNAKSVDERLVDEKEDQRLAAQAAVDASQANLAESKALVASAAAKVDQAKADLVDAEAEVDVAKANLSKAEVFVEYTRVIAPYDGVVTSRAFHRGDFIRGADQSAALPMLTVERTDIVRLVVYVPDGDVPFTDPGDETVTEIDALPGHKFAGKISRIAFSEDKKTKTMRTEVDLPNDRGLLRNGMYGRTKLILQDSNPDAFTVPSSALVGTTKGGKGILFLVSEGIARKTSVEIGVDNGIQAEITKGITSNDQVIVGNINTIKDGQHVEVHELNSTVPNKR